MMILLSVQLMADALEDVGKSDRIDQGLAGSLISCCMAAKRNDIPEFNRRLCDLVSYGDRMPDNLKVAVTAYVSTL